MNFNLYWQDIKNNTYNLGILTIYNSKYYFTINYEELKKATAAGCYGIGEFNLLYDKFESDELFPFFRRRIPLKDQVQIDKVLKELDMTEYNEIELLKRTKGRLNTDRYYVEEIF